MNRTARRIAALVLTAAAVGSAPAADAAPAYNRTVTAARVCQTEDGSAPADRGGCVFLSDFGFVVNYDGGARWVYVAYPKTDPAGARFTVSRRVPVTVRLNTKARVSRVTYRGHRLPSSRVMSDAPTGNLRTPSGGCAVCR